MLFKGFSQDSATLLGITENRAFVEHDGSPEHLTRQVHTPGFEGLPVSRLHKKPIAGSIGIHVVALLVVGSLHSAPRKVSQDARDVVLRAVPIYAPRIKHIAPSPARLNRPKQTSDPVVARAFVPPPQTLPPPSLSPSIEVLLTVVPPPEVSLPQAPVPGLVSLARPATALPRLPVPVGFPNASSGSVRAEDSARGVPSASFAAARPAGGAGRGNGQGGAGAGGFAPAAILPSPPAEKPVTVSLAVFRGAQITEMPRPTYTEAARNHRVQGSIRIRVVLCADGHVIVKDIVDSVGFPLREAFGLDEAAVAAARRIKFAPASQDGRSVDQPLIVEAVFQLAYQTLAAAGN